MMKTRYLAAAVLLAFLALPSLEAQTKKRLAILPFSGGSGQDGETISVLLSNQRALLNAFTVQPRNSAIDRIMGEQQFQRQSGLINSDAISEIGKLNTADLVVSGYIARLGTTNLLIISIVDVTEVQQIAGVYQTYRSIEEIRGLLPDLSQRLVQASQKEYQNLPGLAIPSFTVPANVNANDAMVLAQILATEIVNLGRYAVFPRNNSVDDVIKEHQFQRSGQTATTMALGTSRSIDYILSSSVMSLGRMNMFGAQILSIEKGEMIVGTDREYQDISDGLNKNLMRDIARELTAGVGGSAQTPEKAPRRTREPREPKEPKEYEPNDPKLWTIGASVGSTFIQPVVVATIHGTVAPTRYSFFDIGLDAGFFSIWYPSYLGTDGRTRISGEISNYTSLYPFVHYALFVPFPRRGGWYIGAGAGWMLSFFDFNGEDGRYVGSTTDSSFFIDAKTGFNIGNVVDLSYTMRTNFYGALHKFSVGYTYRFKGSKKGGEE